LIIGDCPEVLAPVSLVLLVVGELDAADEDVEHTGVLIVSESVETVPPNAKALPIQVTALPIVIPASSMSVPTNVELAPRVVASVGVQKTSQAVAPSARLTTELAPVVKSSAWSEDICSSTAKSYGGICGYIHCPGARVTSRCKSSWRKRTNTICVVRI